MHELSVAQNIIEIIKEHASKMKTRHVTEVIIDIGAISGVIPENLEFAWDIATKNTIAENSKLRIHFIPAKAKCLQCAKEFKVDDIYTMCEFCGSLKFDIIQGKELKVKSIVVE